MRNIYLLFVCITSMFVACNNEAPPDAIRNNIAPAQRAAEAASNPDTPVTHIPLTKEQAENFFPKQLGGYKLFNVDVSQLKSKERTAGMYIKDNDFNHSLVYTLEDGLRKGAAVLRNFEAAYAADTQGPAGATYIRTERDGYKTIALLQPAIKRNTIGFVYNNRFKLSLEGVQEPDTLWKYVSRDDLEKLDTY